MATIRHQHLAAIATTMEEIAAALRSQAPTSQDVTSTSETDAFSESSFLLSSVLAPLDRALERADDDAKADLAAIREQTTTLVGHVSALLDVARLLQAELAARVRAHEDVSDELSRKKTELANAQRVAHIARDEAERAARAKNSFLGMISHELRTPLTTIQLQLQRFQRQRANLSETQRSMLRTMETSSHRLLQLINSVLELVRLESGRLDLNLSIVDPVPLVQALANELRPSAEAKGLDLIVVDAGALPLRSDARLVRLVGQHLIENAVKFTESGGVTVTLTQLSERLRLQIEDTGRGIAPSAQARIFLPFEQLEEPNHKHTPGVGLGLTLVRNLMAKLGGTLELTSNVGQGSTFVAEFPSIKRADVDMDLDTDAPARD